LLSMLSEGELVARGLPSSDGHSELVLRTLWAHQSFRFDADTGDLYEDNPASRTRWDSKIKRWSGLVLELPETATSAMTGSSRVTGNDPTPINQEAQKASASQSSVSTVASESACRDWLIDAMRKSLTERQGTRDDWWAKAKLRWPLKLSKRGFDRAWSEAIRESGAVSWGKAGAPKKSPH